MPNHSTPKERVEHGLETIPADRTVNVSLRDLMMKIVPVLIAVLVMLFSTPAEAWTTRVYTDEEAVGRAELIVIAHIKEGSIKKVMFHQGGISYEHHATLVITRMIKGELHEKEMPITIGYGLLPVSARQEKHMENGDIVTESRPEEPGEGTKIWEDNPSEGFFRPSGDVHQDQIWLLHRLGPARENNIPEASPANSIGVEEPEDIQPVTKEEKLSKIVHAK